MKHLKLIKKQVAYFLTIVLIVPLFNSCSAEKSIENDSALRYQESAEKILEVVSNFRNNTSTTSVYRSTSEGITQEMVDEYAEMLGYNAGDFSLSSVENIINKQSEGKTYEELMEEYNLSSFARLTLQEIKDGDWKEDLENNQQYQSLNANEKEILSMSNAYMRAVFTQADDGHTIEEATGALVGLLIGGACCGVVGAIGGAIIGALIGGGC